MFSEGGFTAFQKKASPWQVSHLPQLKCTTVSRGTKAPPTGWEALGCIHRKTMQRLNKDHLVRLRPRPGLVSSWCGASRTIRHCWWPWDIPRPAWAAAPV